MISRNEIYSHGMNQSKHLTQNKKKLCTILNYLLPQLINLPN
jgi:hypothetical protein